MKLKHVALLFLVSAFTGGVGYYVGILREPGAVQLPKDGAVALEQLVSTKSFSEVEQARAVLDALAERYVENAQGLIVQEIMSRNPNFGIRQSKLERPMIAAIRMLDEALPEFRGTGAELRLLQPLLYALKDQRLYDRWLDVYLDALYRQPTHEMVSSLADDAGLISQAVGRESELAAGLRYVNDIPLNFPAKSILEPSVARAHGRITSENHECSL